MLHVCIVCVTSSAGNNAWLVKLNAFIRVTRGVTRQFWSLTSGSEYSFSDEVPVTSRSPLWQSVNLQVPSHFSRSIPRAMILTCRSSGHSGSSHQLRWEMDIANRSIGLGIAWTLVQVNTFAGKKEQQSRKQQKNRCTKLWLYDRAYYKLWTPISWLRLRQRSICVDRLRLI